MADTKSGTHYGLIFDFFLYLLHKKKVLCAAFVLFSVAAFLYAFLVAEKQYISSATILPPFSSSNMPFQIAGLNLNLGSKVEVTPEQIISIYTSKGLRRKVIKRFDLYRRYELEDEADKLELALAELEENLGYETNEIGAIGYESIVSIKLYAIDRDPDTCYQIVSYAYHLLDSAVKSISMEHAHENRVFYEEQLETSKQILDSLQQVLAAFQQKHKVIDVSTQTRLALENLSQLKSEIIKNEIKANALALTFREDYPEIRRLQKENRVFKRKLHELETKESPDILLGLNRSTELGPKYYNLIRDVEARNQIILFLTQQVERARINEVKSVSSVKIVDSPFVPDYKFRPKRSILILIIVFVGMCFTILLLCYIYLYHTVLKHDRRFDAVVKALKGR